MEEQRVLSKRKGDDFLVKLLRIDVACVYFVIASCVVLLINLWNNRTLSGAEGENPVITTVIYPIVFLVGLISCVGGIILNKKRSRRKYDVNQLPLMTLGIFLMVVLFVYRVFFH